MGPHRDYFAAGDPREREAQSGLQWPESDVVLVSAGTAAMLLELLSKPVGMRSRDGGQKSRHVATRRNTVVLRPGSIFVLKRETDRVFLHRARFVRASDVGKYPGVLESDVPQGSAVRLVVVLRWGHLANMSYLADARTPRFTLPFTSQAVLSDSLQRRM